MVKLCAWVLLFGFTACYGFISFDDIRPGSLEDRIRVEEDQVRPKSGKGKDGAISGHFFGRTIISRKPGSSGEVEIHEFQHQPSSGDLTYKGGPSTVAPTPEPKQVRRSKQPTNRESSLSLSSADWPPEAELGLAGELQGHRQRRNLGTLGANLMRLEKIADNPPGAAEMRKAEMEQAAAAAKARASPPPSRPEPAPVQSSAPPEHLRDDTEEVTEAVYHSTPLYENHAFEERERQPVDSSSLGLEPYAMYTEIPSYASRYRRSFASVGQVGLQFASGDKLSGGIQEVPSSLPVGSLPTRGGVLDVYDGPLPKAQSQMPLERSFAPPADISFGGEAASSFRQPVPVADELSGFQSFEPASMSQEYAPDVKSGFDVLPSVPESFTVAPGASDVHTPDRPVVEAPDSHLSGPPSAQGADVPSIKYESYLPPPPPPGDSYGFPVRQSGRLASSYSGDLPSSMPESGGIDGGFKDSPAYGLGDEAKSVDGIGRWKRSIGSIASVGMQFSNKEKVKGGASALPSSVPLASLPVHGEIIDSYDRPLPKAESEVPAEPSFAPPADISGGGEAANTFRQPAPVSDSLSGFDSFKSSSVPQDSAPDSSNSDIAAALLFLALNGGSGVSEVQSPDKAAVRAPDSELPGPPSVQGTDVPSLKYDGYLPPAPAPEESYGFPAHQSGSLASSYSKGLPSSVPERDGFDSSFKDSSIYGLGDEIQSVDEPGRWKRSMESISSVGMQFASHQKSTDGIGDLSSSVPVASFPARGGILDTYGSPLPSACSEMPLKDAFAPRADISNGGELASSFQQPVPVSSALGGLQHFKPAHLPHAYGPSVKSGFDFLPAVPQSFAVHPGASDVQKLDRPPVPAPDSQLSGPPLAQGPDVPPMKYESYVPPPPTPEDSLSFPVHQSGRLASSYSGHLPSSMPAAGGISEDYRAPSVDGVSSEEASSHSLRFELIK